MKRAFWLGMVLALHPAGGYAAAVKPVVSVKIDEGTPRYIYENKNFECSGAHGENLGCTRVHFYVGYDNVMVAPDGTLAGLELLVGLKNVEVEVSTELEKGSCLFNATLKHELTHLNLHRRVLKYHAPEIAKSVLAALDKMQPPLTLKKAMSAVDRVTSAGLKRMMADDSQKNALMDTDGAYIHVNRQCPEEKQK